MKEIRISQHIWQGIMTEEERTEIKEIAQRYAYDFGYDFEWEFIWIRFDDERYVIARIHSGGLI